MKIILASHGTLAKGMYDALTLIFGEQQNVEIISAYTDGNDDIESLADYALADTGQDECLVITDVLGGSVNNVFLSRMEENPGIKLITGMNLSLLLEIFSRRDELNDELLRVSIEDARRNCMYCNDLKSDTNEKDFDF